MKNRSQQIFNTRIYTPKVGICVKPFLHSLGKLGAYCVVEANLDNASVMKIVVGQNQTWLSEALLSYFSRPVVQLTVKEIQAFLVHLADQHEETGILTNLFPAISREKLRRTGVIDLHFLEDIKEHAEKRELVLAVIGQYLIERFTKRDSRLVPVSIDRNGNTEKHWIVLIFPKKKSMPPVFWDPSQVYPALNNREVPFLESVLAGEEDNDRTYLKIRTQDLNITYPSEVWNPKTNELSVMSSVGKELNFRVEGRTPAGKRFQAEDKLIQQADEQDMVPVELGFHPFWFQFGHTTIRVGEALYELTNKGWRRHNQGGDKARAFIFNNPFFKTQIEKYEKRGMPPVSLGCKLLVTKKQVNTLLHYLNGLVDADYKDRETFSLLRNNCNHGIMRVLEHADISGFTSKGYYGFSSILSFRKALLTPEINVAQLYVYPLPGVKCEPHLVRRWLPTVLYKHNSVPKEIYRGWFLIYIQSFKSQSASLVDRFKRAVLKQSESVTSHEIMEW